MKRFTETKKWDDPWFRKLSPSAKHLWQWLLDHCDNAGVIETDLELATFQVGEPIKLQHLTELESRFERLLDGKKIWIRKFIPFQWGKINRLCKQHTPVFDSIERHNLNLDSIKGLSMPIECTLNTHSVDNDTAIHAPFIGAKEKEKEKEKTKESIKELPDKLNTARMQNKWKIWMNHRRGFKKPTSWLVLFNEQIEFLSQFDEPNAFEILTSSLRNGYQGLFEPKENYGRTRNSQINKPNPRNDGVCVGPTDYTHARPRAQREREAAEAAGMAGQVDANENYPP